MDLRKLKTLIDLVSESNISELEITEAEGKVRIVKAGAAVPVAMAAYPVAAPNPALVAQAVAAATRGGAKSIIGGGDSVKAINKAKLGDQVTFMSTGGGASLEFLEGQVLPGVAALNDR